MHSLYSRHPNGPFKTLTGTRRARPRSVFNVKLFNGNLESFIKVLITSLPAWHCSSSYLFSVLLWLSGHFGGFPQNILALILSFTNKQKKQWFVLRWILETFLMSQWALAVCVWDVRVALIDLEGLQEERSGSLRDECLSWSAPLTHCWPGITELLWQRYSLFLLLQSESRGQWKTAG